MSVRVCPDLCLRRHLHIQRLYSMLLLANRETIQLTYFHLTLQQEKRTIYLFVFFELAELVLLLHR